MNYQNDSFSRLFLLGRQHKRRVSNGVFNGAVKLVHGGVVRCGDALGGLLERLGEAKGVAAHGVVPFWVGVGS